MENVDPSNMHDMIANFPQQFSLGDTWAQHIRIDRQITRVIVTGMGGSALPTDLVNLVFRHRLPSPLEINRSYTISEQLLGPSTLVIACSFSGNTEETISAYRQAHTANTPVVAIAGGGELIRLSQQLNQPYIELIKESPDFQPRMGSGYFFGSLSRILCNIGWLTEADISSMLEDASHLDASSFAPTGQQLADTIGNTIPVIYTTDTYWPIARIFKIKINENSKTPAFWNYLPEANHNEMVGYSLTQGIFSMISLIDPQEDSRVNDRFDIMSDLLKNRQNISGAKYLMQGDSLFTKTFSTLIVADWTSYYLALNKKIDPTPVAMVEEFKSLVVK